MHAPLKTRQARDQLRFERLHRKQRNQPNHRAHFQVVLVAVRKVNRIVKKSVFFIPERYSIGPVGVDCVRDVNEMLKKFTGYVFIGWFLACQFQRNRQHVQAIHPHPAGAVRLLEVASGRQRLRTVEHANVVEAQEAALKHIHPIRILAVHPPGKIQQEFVEHAFEEAAVGAPVDALFDLIHAPSRPGVHRRIHVAKGPFIRGQLPVRMHVPFP